MNMVTLLEPQRILPPSKPKRAQEMELSLRPYLSSIQLVMRMPMKPPACVRIVSQLNQEKDLEFFALDLKNAIDRTNKLGLFRGGYAR